MGSAAPLRVGERIPGSRLLRDYCRLCRDPIRVTVVKKDGDHCADCDPDASGVWRARRGPGAITASENAYHGGRFNRGEW